MPNPQTRKKKKLSRLAKANAKKEERLKLAERAGYIIENGEVQHRRVWKKHHKEIPRDWVVHHIDFVKKNNDIDNLVALPSAIHDAVHHIQRKKGSIFKKEDLMEVHEAAKQEWQTLNLELEKAKKRVATLEARLEVVGRTKLDEKAKDLPTRSLDDFKRTIFQNNSDFRARNSGTPETKALHDRDWENEKKQCEKALEALRIELNSLSFRLNAARQAGDKGAEARLTRRQGSARKEMANKEGKLAQIIKAMAANPLISEER